jgi:Tfp pilus assembly protein PilX
MRRKVFNIPDIPRGFVFSIVVVILAAVVLIVFGSGWPQGLVERLSGEREQAAMQARLAVLREGRAGPDVRLSSHADALRACSEAQDFAVRVAQGGDVDDAALATREMRRVCQPYFDSAARQPAIPAT